MNNKREREIYNRGDPDQRQSRRGDNVSWTESTQAQIVSWRVGLRVDTVGVGAVGPVGPESELRS